MVDEQNKPTVMSDAEISAAVSANVCAVCDKSKVSGRAFCPTDELALPIYPRSVLSRGQSEPGFFDCFRSALRHLQLNRTRVMRLPGRRGEWEYSSHDELIAAGFRFVEHAQCGVPRCFADITWYRAPQGGLVPVNFRNLQPHRTTCADPDYFRRRRELRRAQTSARRKRAR